MAIQHLPTPWHSLSREETARVLQTAAGDGLSAAEAALRLQHHGPNALPEAERRSLLRMALAQFTDFMIVALLLAAGVAGLAGDALDAGAILVIVLLNAAIGLSQEWRAEEAMSALRRLAAPVARVRRGGALYTVPAEQLVPGDIVLLEAGNWVPADLRLVQAVQLRIAEAVLTGESVPSDKLSEAQGTADMALGDRTNMAYRGTVVTHGRGSGLVVATGRDTELGRIAELMRPPADARTPLQRRLAIFGSRLAWVVLGLCSVIFLVGLWQGEALLPMFLTAVSLAVAAIPEALPAVVGIALALGARRMAHRQALTRRLPAVEALGSVTVICSDKTGTLTRNRMHVEAFWVDGEHHPAPADGEPWTMLMRALVLSNDVVIDDSGDAVGDPTEVAMLEAARAAGLDKREAEARWPRVGEVPFDSTRQRMTTFHADGDGVIAFVKGAPEALLPLCTQQLTRTGAVAVDAHQCLRQAEHMAAQGLRVLAVASRRVNALPVEGDGEGDLNLIGLIGLLDPPRPEAAAAVAECKSAGIVPVMITGDHPATARAIARRLAIIGDQDRVVTGAELASLDEPALADVVMQLRVYARVSPEQKIRIVEALQRNGQVVAMTGDGVNDAPALRKADVGVAMGKDGTDVAREASDLVLLDDNFATIVQAVREGRRILDNIRKFVQYVMTGNAGEIATIVLAQALGLPLPLLPIQILWINLITDGLPGLALSGEPAEPGVMQRPPRALRESIMTGRTWRQILLVGLAMSMASLLAQRIGLAVDEAHGRTMVFTVLTLCQLGYVLTVRTGDAPLTQGGLRANPALFAALGLTLVLQLAALYLPALATVLRTEPLQPRELALCAVIAAVLVTAVEASRLLRRLSAGRHRPSSPRDDRQGRQ